MKRMLLLSGLLHGLFIGGLVVENFVWSKPVYHTGHRIYNVNLVSLPVKKRITGPYKVVPKKEAARPDQDAKLAIKRTPKLVSEEPEPVTSFDTDTPGVRLDVKAFEFPYYLSAIQRKIQQNLHVPRLPGIRELRTIIYFKIERNGRILNMEMERSSNNPVFDLAARRALERSDPLPPLPDGFDHAYLGVHFEFEYIQ